MIWAELLIAALAWTSVDDEVGRLLIVDGKDRKLLVVGAHDLSVRRRVDLFRGARGLFVSRDGNTLGITGASSNCVGFVDCETWELQGPVRLIAAEDVQPLARRYFPVSMIEQDGRWWVSCGMRDRILRVDPKLGEVTERVDLNPRGVGSVWPAQFLRTDDGRIVFTAFGSGRLGQILDDEGRVEWSDSTIETPWGLIALGSGQIAVASLDDREVAQLSPELTRVGSLRVVGGPWLVAAGPRDETLVVALRKDKTLAVIDAANGDELVRSDILDEPVADMALSPDRQRVYVTVGLTGEVIVYSVTDLQELARERLGINVMGIVYQERSAEEAAIEETTASEEADESEGGG